MTTFSALCDDLWPGDHVTTAVAVANHLELTSDQRDVLMPVIINGARMIRRATSRRAEEAMEMPRPKRNRQLPLPEVSADPRLAFLDAEFALPDGRYVSWRHATINDHRARIEMLDKMRGSLVETINKHVSVIAEITVNKVQCLGDIYPTNSSKEAAA